MHIISNHWWKKRTTIQRRLSFTAYWIPQLRKWQLSCQKYELRPEWQRISVQNKNTPTHQILFRLFPTGLISECGQLAFMQLKKKKINKQWHILKSSLILNAIYQQYLSLAIQNTYKPWFVVFTCIFFHWIRQNDWYYCHTSYDNK